MKKILVADDEEIIRKTIEKALAGNDYEFIFATDGVQAIEKADKEKPDLILLDVNMPNKDGREVIHDLRRHPATQKIPVILLTGLGETMDKIVGFELGAADYITKPFDAKLLRRRVQKIF